MFLKVILISTILSFVSFPSYAHYSQACNQSLIEKAEKGETASQTLLGWCYNQGHGFEKDTKEAFKWYSKAAISGDAFAQYNLGIMLSTGKPYKKKIKSLLPSGLCSRLCRKMQQRNTSLPMPTAWVKA